MGKKHGQGRIKTPNGNVYVGQFQSDQKHGYGVLTEANGRRYAGNYADGHMHGEGTLFLENGKTKKCEFERGKIKRVISST
mmetsp:Transcript_26936/g.36011  ORF Transcript_26936/g.36011 Transcript_26936/m.36011 type:complete len:81 (+) Transcript_26936:952-1194(+)